MLFWLQLAGGCGKFFKKKIDGSSQYGQGGYLKKLTREINKLFREEAGCQYL